MTLLKRKRSGLSDPMAVVTNFVNACNRHDSEGVSSCLHPDFDSIQPMYPSRNFRGADQVRRNWQAIFDAEPGFRLTVLRSAATGDTVWLELHGAGRDAEVAGVFVMGIQGDRIRWARIYSALVEDAPAAASGGGGAEPPPPLRQVPPLPDDTGWGEVGADTPAEPAASENPVAPVFEIDGGGGSRRRRFRRKGGDGWAPEAPVKESVEHDPLVEEAQVEEAVEQEPVVEEAPAPAPSTPAPTADFAASPAAGQGQSTGSEASEPESEPEMTVETMVEVAPETALVPEALADAPDVDGDPPAGDGEQEPPRWRPV